MRKLFVFTLLCILSGLAGMACQRDQGVEAGNDNYQPRRSVDTGANTANPALDQTGKPAGNQDIQGELIRVDMGSKTMTVRTENGMVQTFKFDNATTIQGVEQPQSTNKRTQAQAANQVRGLVGKEGSEVTITWTDQDDGAKMASNVNVTQVMAKHSSKDGTKSRSKRNTY